LRPGMGSAGRFFGFVGGWLSDGLGDDGHVGTKPSVLGVGENVLRERRVSARLSLRLRDCR